MRDREPDAFNNVRQLWPYELDEQIRFTEFYGHECGNSFEDAKNAKDFFDRLVDLKTRRIRSTDETRYPGSTFATTFSSTPDDVSRLLVTVAKQRYHNQIIIQDLLSEQERRRVVYETHPSSEGVTRAHYITDMSDAVQHKLPPFGSLFRSLSLVETEAGLQSVSFEETKALASLIYRSVPVDTTSSQAGIAGFPSHDKRIRLDEDFEELVATGLVDYLS